jgi:hypothetical protein
MTERDWGTWSVYQDFTGYHMEHDCTGGVMVSMIAFSVVDCKFDPWLGQTKDYEIGICCFSATCAALRRKQRLVGSESG